MTDDLAATLAAVSAALAAAQEPWWVIGSAAVSLHLGSDAGVRDVDVVLSIRDIEALTVRLGQPLGDPTSHPRFRSARFLTWTTGAMCVEFMAGFSIRQDGRWRPVRFVTREKVEVAGSAIFIPRRPELRTLLLDFGRAKDLARAAML